MTPSTTPLALCGELLRDPEGLVARAAAPDAYARLAPRVLGIAVAAAALFGAVVGSYRGGPQVAYAAVKMPLLLLVPLVVGLPAVRALFHLAGRPTGAQTLSMAGLVAMARTSLVALAAAPVLWLAYDATVDYHLAVVLLAGVLVVAGLAGLPSLAKGFGPPTHKSRLAAVAALLLVGAVTAQTGWVLRPFVARPRADVALFRPIEGDILGSLVRAPLAAVDIYVDYAPRRSPWRDVDVPDAE
ncbi:MAG: hypothetical protein R3F59_39230 [Myxococcota bacterium]